MRLKVRPEDFVVQELARLPRDRSGNFGLYRIEKRNTTTLRVQIHIASQLGLRRSDVQAPALKDKKALATQHLSIRGGGPQTLRGPGYTAQLIGRSPRPLRPSDLRGNRFTVTLRDLSRAEVDHLETQIDVVARSGLPNYFDQQRFGSYSSYPGAADHFIGKTILRRDAEEAVRAYFCYPFVGDPKRVRAFKKVARQHWGEWRYLMDQAPRPSNFRSLLTYLIDHPEGFRKALNLIPRRLLSIYLVAYQSYLWNRIVGRYLRETLGPDSAPSFTLNILDLALPVYQEIPAARRTTLAETRVPLPSHRAVYADPTLSAVAQGVINGEGFVLNDLKARILKRAYLPKGKRPLLLQPGDMACNAAQSDELFPGKQALTLTFTLPSGTYATLVIKRLRLSL